jgi:hypothetical protein
MALAPTRTGLYIMTRTNPQYEYCPLTNGLSLSRRNGKAFRQVGNRVGSRSRFALPPHRGAEETRYDGAGEKVLGRRVGARAG